MTVRRKWGQTVTPKNVLLGNTSCREEDLNASGTSGALNHSSTLPPPHTQAWSYAQARDDQPCTGTETIFFFYCSRLCLCRCVDQNVKVFSLCRPPCALYTFIYRKCENCKKPSYLTYLPFETLGKSGFICKKNLLHGEVILRLWFTIRSTRGIHFMSVLFPQDNIETEYKFARAQLWADYIGDGVATLPPPLNLIPSPKSVVRWACKLTNRCFGVPKRLPCCTNVSRC